MDKLHENIIQLKEVRVKRGQIDYCKCTTTKFALDTTQRRVTCCCCGSPIDAFEALYIMANEWQRISRDLEQVFAEHKTIRNPSYRHIETGAEVTALDWAKETYLDTRKELFRLGEIDENEEIPSDEEFIDNGIVELDGNEEYELI